LRHERDRVRDCERYECPWHYGIVTTRSRSSAGRTRSQRSAALGLLIECLHAGGVFDPQRATHLLSRTSPDLVLDAAAHHAVSGIVYERLRGLPDAPSDLLAPLGERYDNAVRHHLRIMWELAKLQPVLDGSGARWAVIKGPAAVELLYDAPGERSYGDLDVLIEPAHFAEVLASLDRNGSRLLDRNWTILRRELRGEVHLELPGGSLLDLHWNLVNMYRGHIRIDTIGLLARAGPVDLGGVRAPTLDATDFVIHLALHGTLAGGDRLKWMFDVARAASRRPPRWDLLIDRAEDWNVSAPVGFLLARSHNVLGSSIPNEVPRRLLGRRYRALMRIADWVSPWERASGRLSTPGLMLSRSMGFGLAGAGQWLVRRAIRNLDPREPAASSAFTPRGDTQDFDAFVQAVIESAQPGQRRDRPASRQVS
jgi:hypothetical protein